MKKTKYISKINFDPQYMYMCEHIDKYLMDIYHTKKNPLLVAIFTYM